MIVAAALYLRGNAIPAGVVLGLAGCMKLVALFLVPVFVLLEVFQVLWARRDQGTIWRPLRSRSIPLVITVGCALVTLVLRRLAARRADAGVRPRDS